MKISAKNILKGTIKSIKMGPVSAEVDIELPGGSLITSVITHSSAEGLGLTVGSPAYAIIKATNVMVGID